MPRRGSSVQSRIVAVATVFLAGVALAGCGHTRQLTAASRCGPGAHTLSPVGAVLYPEVGNGGYVSLHTATHTVYDARTNRFLPGNRVSLTDRATQCLSSLSLDFERSDPGHPPGGPDMAVQSVTVNGRSATFHFALPTYPGDPNGLNDPDPRAHEASQTDPVGGPQHNRLPPACSPQLTSESLAATPSQRLHPELSRHDTSEDGMPCPADKLVITPRDPIRNGARFTVTVAYTGTPGLHYDGDGSTEGWFASSDGNWLATEPVGAEDWMPLNDYPTAKPTYDFSITTERGKTAIANGERISVTDHPPDAEFPGGSTTTVWHAPMPISSYLALTIIGDYRTTVHSVDGVRYYAFQSTAIPARVRAQNAALLATEPAVLHIESELAGRFPFASDGVVVGAPSTHSSDEEMASMIVFPGNGSGQLFGGGLAHETFHQWWGDSVSDAGFDMTFFKEGMATLATVVVSAVQSARHGGDARATVNSPAVTRSLIGQFDAIYASGAGFWQLAPSRRSPASYLDLDAVYERPKAALIALRQILGPSRFDAALQAVQRAHSGGSLTEAAAEAAFSAELPNPSAACRQRLTRFFTQWFDAAYHGSKPQITGPGLAGQPFDADGCSPQS